MTGMTKRLRGAARSMVYRLPVGVERRLLFVYYNRKLPHFSRPVTFSDKIGRASCRERV